MKQGRKIMLVDDDGGIQEVCKVILETEGHVVYGMVRCDTVMDLVEAVVRFGPDLVFMDQTMPRISGSEAIRALRAGPDTRDVPVIYFSGTDDIARLAEEAGANDFLQKPFDIAEMIRMIERYS